MISNLVLRYLCRPRIGHIIKTICITFQTVDAQFRFLWKGPGLASSPHFEYDFSKKYFSCYILLTDQMSLSLLLEILVNMCIAIICLPVYDVTNSEIQCYPSDQAFFLHDHQCREKNLNILKIKRPFWHEVKSIFHHL